MVLSLQKGGGTEDGDEVLLTRVGGSVGMGGGPWEGEGRGGLILAGGVLQGGYGGIHRGF